MSFLDMVISVATASFCGIIILLGFKNRKNPRCSGCPYAKNCIKITPSKEIPKRTAQITKDLRGGCMNSNVGYVDSNGSCKDTRCGCRDSRGSCVDSERAYVGLERDCMHSKSDTIDSNDDFADSRHKN